MSNIDKRALREAAEKALSAGDGNWQTWREAGMNYPEIFTSSGHIVATVNGSFAVVRSDFIAAANPATVLALLDELEAKDKQIADLKEAFSIALSAAGIDSPAAAGKGE
ncbi:Ead/Ea22-like family protein [Enterobacter intestinihominis]